VSPQLERLEGELVDAQRRAHQIAGALTQEYWSTRPAVGEWSVAECVAHLNLTSRAFVPLIRAAMARGRTLNWLGSGPYRMDVVGWFVHWTTDPPVRFRVKTTAPFMPKGTEPLAQALDDFDALQQQLLMCVREAEGLDLGRLRITSPFAARLTYNLYSCLRIIPAHQRQHLSQAGKVTAALRSLHGGA